MAESEPRPRVAFQGAPGAFSHEACRELLPGCTPVPVVTFAEAFAAVESGDCDRAVIPVENSIAGPVPEVAALLPASPLVVESEAWRPIRMMLLAVRGARLADLRTVASHPMALKQCGRAIARLGLRAVEAFDTGGAALELAASGDRTRAAIASRTAGELAGLEVMESDIQDTADNRTRFLVLRRP